MLSITFRQMCLLSQNRQLSVTIISRLVLKRYVIRCYLYILATRNASLTAVTVRSYIQWKQVVYRCRLPEVAIYFIYLFKYFLGPCSLKFYTYAMTQCPDLFVKKLSRGRCIACPNPLRRMIGW